VPGFHPYANLGLEEQEKWLLAISQLGPAPDLKHKSSIYKVTVSGFSGNKEIIT
jgi:hypothetical protein